MARALYDPADGYYTRHGAGRDYRTAPQTSPAFGHLIGAALARMWRLLGEPSQFDAIELGAGDGRLRNGAVGWLRARAPAAPVRYVTLDRASAGADVRGDAARLPLRPIRGCLLSNELFDALPVNRLRWTGSVWEELWVVDGERFEAGPLSGEAAPPAEIAPRPRQIVDVAPAAAAVMRQIAGRLEQGYVLTIDYGGGAADVYGPHRMDGTALAYWRNRARDDLLARPGEQDLTAHVDFDALRRAGEEAGLTTLRETTQRDFLLELGLREWLERLQPAYLSPSDLFNARAAALELVHPGRLGKLRVLLQGRGVAPGW